jgi:uncharacterized repeat protein (TIGR03803 family)
LKVNPERRKKGLCHQSPSRKGNLNPEFIMKTCIKNQLLLTALTVVLGLILAGQVTAQTFTTLHNFAGPPNDGYNPQAGLVISGNTLYGACDSGGDSRSGTVFAVSTNGTNFTSLYTFNFASQSSGYTNSDGKSPDGTLLLSGNTLYGTAYYGGTNGNGTVFKVSANAHAPFTTLHSFAAGSGFFPRNYTNSDGACPEVGLILSGNTLYGTTEKGGSSGYGTVFKVNTDGTGFMNLHSFTNGSDGAIPHGLVISGDTLYGTALGLTAVGLSGNGTVFALNINGTGFTTLHSFTEVTLGLLLSGNTLYGIGGSSTNLGVFSVSINGTGFTNLYTFTATSGPLSTNSDGAEPIENGGLILSGNTIYGTAENGGSSGNGTVFALNTNGTGFTTLHSFTGGSDGANPYAGLTLSGNTLYGTATAGGNSGGGTVFSISLAGVTTTSLPNGTEGVAYNQTLAATGGQTPYTWTNISGALPPGLTLATNGVISGIPTTNGTFNFTVQETDASSAMATQALELMVGGPPSVTIQPTNNSVTAAVGSNVTFAVSVAGNGPFTYQWQLNGTNLNGTIATVAGNGTSGYSGDGGAAIEAELYDPEGTAVDSTGNLFIADTDNNLIRKVGTNGIITLINEELYSPEGVAVDATGNLFIADVGNQRIREVGTNGIITTVAGNGTWGYSGDGGAATNTELYYPAGVAVDSTGNLFIADMYNLRIREVGTNGIIITVAGNGTQGYSGDGGAATNAEMYSPEGVAVDATGNLFIADTDNEAIREVGTNGIITTVAGNGTYGFSGDGGAAINAELYSPEGAAVDATGNLFIADTGNQRIRKVVNPGIPGPTLVLKNVGFGNAGAYDVVVSSPYGSVTSSVVNVTITLPPVILSVPQISSGNTNFTFQISGPTGSNYVLQVSTNLLNWNSVSTFTIPVSGSINASNAISGYNRQFYRVHLQ